MIPKLMAFLVAMAGLAAVAAGQPARDYAALKAGLSDSTEARQAAALRQLDSRPLTAADVDWLLDCFGWKGNRLAPRGDLDLRRNCAYLLGVAGDPRAVPALMAGLDQRVDAECSLALARIGDRRAAPALCDYLKNEKGSKTDRGAACYALGRTGDPNAIPTVISLSGESGRVFPLWDLLGFGDAAVDPVIKTVAANPSTRLIFTLGELRDARAVPCLAKLAAQPDKKGNLATAALYALRKIKTKEALEVLESVSKNCPDAGLRQTASRLRDDALAATNPPTLSREVGTTRPATAGASQDKILEELDRVIESFDVPWQVKEQARDRADRIRQTYRFKGAPQTWDSLVFIIASVKSPDGVTHKVAPEELKRVQEVFESLIADVDWVSQGRMKLRLHFRFVDAVPQLETSSAGVSTLPVSIRNQAHAERAAKNADHLFLVWFVPEGLRGPSYTNGGAASQIPVKTKQGVVQCSDLGTLHEMAHSMNNCLASLGYEEGQMPNLHYGVAQILYRAKRLDGTAPDRVRLYLRRYITGGMWANLSRAKLPEEEMRPEDPEDGK